MENYRNALSEVYYIINYMENNTSKLIPIEVYEEIKNNMNKDYKITKKDILEKNISETARACLSVIYTEYLCTEEERKKWNELDKLYSLEQEKSRARKMSRAVNYKKLNNKKDTFENVQIIIKEEPSIIWKLIEKIKNFFFR